MGFLNLYVRPAKNGQFCLGDLWAKPHFPPRQTQFWCLLSVQQNGWSSGVNWTEMANSQTHNLMAWAYPPWLMDRYGRLVRLPFLKIRRNADSQQVVDTPEKIKVRGGQNLLLDFCWPDMIHFCFWSGGRPQKTMQMLQSKKLVDAIENHRGK